MVFFWGIGLAGCHSAPALSPAELAGKHLYSVRCAHCHEDNDLALKRFHPICTASLSEKRFQVVPSPQMQNFGV
jgi:cytochrome c peroxidase